MNGYSSARGRIAVLVEAHFDETEYRRFNEFFPEHGYAVDYASHLWNQPSLTFKGNDMTAEVTVDIEVESLDLGDYQGLILIGGYFLLANLGLLNWLNWNIAWPVILIAIGIYLVVRRLR